MNFRVVIGIVITVVALVSSVTGVLYSQSTGSGNAGLDPAVAAQAPLVEASRQIHDLWLANNLSDFTGVSLAEDNSELVLYWKGGQLPNDMLALVTTLRRTVSIRVVNAAHSLTEFETEAKRLIEQGRVGTVIVNESGPSSDFSKLEVGIDTNVDQPDADKIAVARTAITSTLPLSFSVEKLPTKFSRWGDTSPFYGSAAIDHRNWLGEYEYCTTGFAVTTSSGTEGLLTALHCGYGDDWRTPNGNRLVGTISTPAVCTLDTGTIVGQDYSPRIYKGSWNGSNWASVKGQHVPAVGEIVNVNGSHSGQHAVRVESTFRYTGGCSPWAVGPGFWTVDQQGDGSVGDGDSGAGVFRHVTGGVRGVGITLGGDTINHGATCEGRQASWRFCSSRAFHMHLHAVLNGLNVTLQTE